MKYWLPKILLLCMLMGCASAQLPVTSYIFDYEEVLTADQELELNELVRNHERTTSNEIAIVTTPDWGEHENAVLYSVDFGDRIGVGKQEKNNGVVIVFSKNMRETRISTGLGTEHVLTDEIAQVIVDSVMVPKFKQGEYYEGIYAGTKAVVEFLEKPGNEI